MVMKNRIFTNNLRNLRRNFPRFISLLLMSLLGVFVFVGLQATAPDMIQTLDRYLDDHNVYDIKVVSNLGLSQEDIDAISEISNVAQVMGIKNVDALAKCGQDEKVITISTVPTNINKIELLDGRLPESEDEIVVENALLKYHDLSIGDTVEVDHDFLRSTIFKIVGTIDSPLYYNSVSISQSRGNTNIGNGKISYYTYVSDEAFVIPSFTACYVTVDEASSCTTSEDSYVDIVRDAVKNIETMEKLQVMGMDPTWYVTDRTDYITYSDYIDDAHSIANLSKIFPVVFFAVAVLVSLISMNRMVEDDRLEIGTLKSLGFTNSRIAGKYFSFSFIATAIGGVIGAVLGCIIIPSMIFGIYRILFDLSNLELLIPWNGILLGFLIMLACVCGTSIITAYKELKEKPSELIRPKAPKRGRRVFLERIPFIWSRLKFSNKVTVRNIFRYKKRVLATVFGIAGCTALMLIGFGIKDSVAEIAAAQYGGIFQYDGAVFLSCSDTIEEAFETVSIDDYILARRLDVKNMDSDANLVVFESAKDLAKFAKVRDKLTKEELKLEPGKVIISDKLADLNKLKEGDMIELEDSDHNIYRFEIQAVFQNYLEHFIFVDKETFGEKELQPNIAYFFSTDLTAEEEDELKEKLLQQDGVIFVNMMGALVESAGNMLNSLNQVVWILIILAALLAFVVLYNLSNINISERKREIATLKVLGFYDSEVDNYITKETIILTILGIVIGLVAGKHLTHIVVATVEIERARFMNWVNFDSFLYATALSTLFTIVVNFVTHFKLKKIDMIDSLKSVE